MWLSDFALLLLLLPLFSLLSSHTLSLHCNFCLISVSRIQSTESFILDALSLDYTRKDTLLTSQTYTHTEAVTSTGLVRVAMSNLATRRWFLSFMSRALCVPSFLTSFHPSLAKIWSGLARPTKFTWKYHHQHQATKSLTCSRLSSLDIPLYFIYHHLNCDLLFDPCVFFFLLFLLPDNNNTTTTSSS